VPEVAFEVLVRQQIARLLEPSLDCAHKVYKELRDIVGRIDLNDINRFQRLKYKISDVMETVLDKCLTPTTDMIIQLIEIENAHINTNHPDFVGSADTLLNMFQGENDDNEDQSEENQTPKPKSLI
jgi:dynamin 1-like protein